MKKILVAMALVMGLSYGVCAEVVEIGDRVYSNNDPSMIEPGGMVPGAERYSVHYRVGNGPWIDTGGSLQRMWNKNNELHGKNTEGRYYVYRGGTRWVAISKGAALDY